ncbi:MAG: YdcF family protein [Rhodospirillales bacterium]|nr:YdcF family protein [Rhodospirillales bacterium]
MSRRACPGRRCAEGWNTGLGHSHARAASHLVLSGGIVGPPPAEAQVMRELAEAMGVDAARIVIEDEARNTFENAVYAGRIIRDRGWRHVVLVTDAFHMPRAAFVFTRLGIAVERCEVPRQPGVSRVAWLRSHLDERLRLFRSAALFAVGAHKPLVERVWRR